jgi:hypothetical protein
MFEIAAFLLSLLYFGLELLTMFLSILSLYRPTQNPNIISSKNNEFRDFVLLVNIPMITEIISM